jgi:hypothetical protein
MTSHSRPDPADRVAPTVRPTPQGTSRRTP